MIQLLPESLIHEVLLYCNYNSKIRFCLTKSGFHRELLKDYKEATVRDPQEVDLWIMTETFRLYIENAIVRDSSKHLSLLMGDAPPRKFVYELAQKQGYSDSFRLKHLTTTFGYFNRLIRHQITKLQSIRLFIDRNNEEHLLSLTSDFDDSLQYLADHCIELGLKEIILMATGPPRGDDIEEEDDAEDRFSLPVFFEGLETLKVYASHSLTTQALRVSEYTSLRVLTLHNCLNISDATSLSHVYDLSLMRCPNITDISPLTDNHKVLIAECPSIIKYTDKVFKRAYDIVLDLSRFRKKSIDNTFKITQCEQVRSLQIENDSNNLLLSPIKSFLSLNYLKILNLLNVSHFSHLPENQLREVYICDCPHFHSCENMGHIYLINLEELPSLKSLEGLGRGNRLVTINNINNNNPIEGIHLLQDSKILHIFDDVLKDSTGFESVEEILVSGSSVGMRPENITDIILNDIPHVSFFPSLRRCKYLGMRVGDIKASEVRFLFEQVLACPTIHKLSLSSAGISDIVTWTESIREVYDTFESFQLAFTIDSSTIKQIYFLRNTL